VTRDRHRFDHAGFLLKEHFIPILTKDGHEVADVGTHRARPVDYPIFCSAVGRAVRDGEAEVGIVPAAAARASSCRPTRCGGSGACNDLFTARFARAHNDANVPRSGPGWSASGWPS
jgi:RpiB/LacA/LacB family sugar-phosphate isomerase